MQGKMMKNKANRARRLFGDGDAAVFADGDRVSRWRYWFEKRFKVDVSCPRGVVKIHRLVFLKKPDAKLEKGLRGFRATALFECVFQVVHNGSGGPAARGEGAD